MHSRRGVSIPTVYQKWGLFLTGGEVFIKLAGKAEPLVQGARLFRLWLI
jgi:hypothetical protein